MVGTVTAADRREAATETVGFRTSPATWAKARVKARRWMRRRLSPRGKRWPKGIYVEPNFPARAVLSEEFRIFRSRWR